MTVRPGRLVLLGHPVRHSLSSLFQNAALRSLGIPVVYEALDTSPSELPERLRSLAAMRAAGNVTIPHKEAAAGLCQRLTPIAERVGAVNTFWVADDRTLVGDNTDVDGFDHLAKTAMGGSPTARHVAVLGAGGAAAAVLAALERWPACEVSLYNRSLPRLERLAARFAVVTRSELLAEAAVQGCDLVVNATPVGLEDEALPVRVEALEPDAVVVDLICRRDETAWVRAARARGHRAADGLAMLVEQGALAFERWFETPAPRDVMWRAVEAVRDPSAAGWP